MNLETLAMPKKNKLRQNLQGGHLLLLGCSDRKCSDRGKLPAIELYDGVNFRVLRTFLNEFGWPPGLMIKILSAKYGLIDATTLIEPYDQRIDKQTASRINRNVLRSLKRIGDPSSIFVNLGQDYLPAVQGMEDLFTRQMIVHANGGIGQKMAHMKKWLNDLPNKTATLPGHKDPRSYLYFFPDWDDYVNEPFVHETAEKGPTTTEKKYAHEIYGEKQTPYDGMLVSLAQLYTGKGSLSRLDPDGSGRQQLRSQMRIPKRLLLFGDCGAFSYAFEDKPPFSPEEAARLYDRFGFDVGASVDHIPLPEIVVEGDDGKTIKRALTPSEQKQRMNLTVRNAEAFLAAWRKYKYRFVPIGAIQGINLRSYVKCVHQYIDMGYKHIALGGLVPKTDSEILEICSATREAIQTRTRREKENIWVHLFGILRPKIQSCFRILGTSSFDSASYLRKAWLRSDQNYLSPTGDRWYGTIRVPMSSSKRLRETAEANNISTEALEAMELRCLEALAVFDGTGPSHEEVMDAVNDYGPLLERRGEDNHFFEKHTAILTDRPWEHCRCAVCRQIGIDVVVFRGAGRNKRRGFHNTWVFYHKIIHGK